MQEWTVKLQKIHEDIASNPARTKAYEDEKEALSKLNYWMRLDEYVLRQKARIQWIRLGDCSNQFSTRIDCLMDGIGNVVNDPQQVEKLIKDFYLNLLGSYPIELAIVDLKVVS